MTRLFDKETLMKFAADQIIIKDLTVKGQLGPDAWIMMKDQYLRFNIIGHIPSSFENTDEIRDTVSYSVIANHIQALVEGEKNIHSLQELAAKVALDCLDGFGLQGITVKIEKLHALLNAGSVGVEITRTAQEIPFLKVYKLGAPSGPSLFATENEDCIFISNMLLYCIIGVNDCERVAKQKLMVNVHLHFPPSDSDASRNNYRFVSSLVQSFIESSSYKTL